MDAPFPPPHDDDAEDVAWGLTTGAALWKQGERHDAIVWLKRAVEAANEAGAAVRADELNRAATDLIAVLAAPAAASRRAPSAPKLTARTLPTGVAPPVPSARKPASGGAPSPSSIRQAAPVPPKPPPPPRSKLPSGETARVPSNPSLDAASAPPLNAPPAVAPLSGPDPSAEPTQVRPPMPSVTTSAPTIEALAQPVAEPEPPREPPPPPSIVPDLPVSQAPAEEAPAAPPALVVTLKNVAHLTPLQKDALARTATIESLGAEEDVSITGLALIVDGQASAQATVADVTAVTLRRGELMYARSSIADTLSLRLVAEADPTIIALWDAKTADELLSDTPDLVERLLRESDRTQTIAGCTMGPLGERLDESLRSIAIQSLEVRILQPQEVVAAMGQAVPGMVIVGVGSLELEGGTGQNERLGPGDFLFATEVLAAGAAPATARAGAKGAIVLFGDRSVAHELLVTCPPLLEVFAGM